MTCGHPVWVELGTLGTAHWFRCRDCGLNLTVPTDDDEDEEL